MDMTKRYKAVFFDLGGTLRIPCPMRNSIR